MSGPEQPPPPAHDLDSYEQFVEFFAQDVMAAYLQQADRFVVETDYFAGHLSSRYSEGSTHPDPIDIRFGYRTLESGDLTIAAFRPDLYQKSPAHVQRWSAFKLDRPRWAKPDERYSFWLRRYFDGDWNVENGPRAQVEAVVGTIYGLLIDGLDKACTFVGGVRSDLGAAVARQPQSTARCGPFLGLRAVQPGSRAVGRGSTRASDVPRKTVRNEWRNGKKATERQAGTSGDRRACPGSLFDLPASRNRGEDRGAS